MTITRTLPIAIAALVAVAAAGGVAAAQDQNKDVATLAGMKVTLQQAIGVAESQTGGRAVSADAARQGAATTVEVEVAGPQGVKTVTVDAQTGRVTATQDGSTDND